LKRSGSGMNTAQGATTSNEEKAVHQVRVLPLEPV
jgi:hypothetical protein